MTECCTKRIYRWKPPEQNALRARWWSASEDRPHLDPLEWDGPPDPVSGFPLPTADAPDFDVLNSSTSISDSNSGAGAARYGIIDGWVYIETGSTQWRDNNANTGEFGMVLSGDCCGGVLTERPGGNHTAITSGADRTIMDANPITGGKWAYTLSPQSDNSAFGGLDLEQSVDGNAWSEVTRMQADKPEVESMEIPCCQELTEEQIEAGWQYEPLSDCCQPKYVSPGGTNTHPEPVSAFCEGPFVIESARTGWWAGWTPVVTSNQATTEIVPWRSLGGPVTSPDCVTDLTVAGDLGNHYPRVRQARAYIWTDARLLVNGTAVWTRINEKYRYIDERDRHSVTGGAPGIPVEIELWGPIVGGRLAVPASATVELQVAVRWNLNGAQDNAWAQYIGGLRSQSIFHFHRREELIEVIHA